LIVIFFSLASIGLLGFIHSSAFAEETILGCTYCPALAKLKSWGEVQDAFFSEFEQPIGLKFQPKL